MVMKKLEAHQLRAGLIYFGNVNPVGFIFFFNLLMKHGTIMQVAWPLPAK